MTELLEREIFRANNSREQRAGIGERGGETRHRQNGFVAPHDAATRDRQFLVRLAQRKEVLLVAKEIGASREVSRMRRDLEFEGVAVLRGFVTRLQVQ